MPLCDLLELLLDIPNSTIKSLEELFELWILRAVWHLHISNLSIKRVEEVVYFWQERLLLVIC